MLIRIAAAVFCHDTTRWDVEWSYILRANRTLLSAGAAILTEIWTIGLPSHAAIVRQGDHAGEWNFRGNSIRLPAPASR